MKPSNMKNRKGKWTKCKCGACGLEWEEFDPVLPADIIFKIFDENGYLQSTCDNCEKVRAKSRAIGVRE